MRRSQDFPFRSLARTHGGMATASVPTLEIEDPAGRRVVLAARSPDDRLGDLADALGLAPGDALQLDGRQVARSETLAKAGIVRGSRLDVAGIPAPLARAGGRAGLRGRAGVGPRRRPWPPAATSSGGRRPRPCRSTTRRSSRTTCSSTSAPDGAVEAVQLTGRVPCRVDGEPVDAATPLAGGATITLGSSRLRLAAPGEPRAPAATVATSGRPVAANHPPHATRAAAVGPDADPGPPAPPAHARTAGAAASSPRRSAQPGPSSSPSSWARRCSSCSGSSAPSPRVGMWLAGRIGAAREGRRARAGRAAGRGRVRRRCRRAAGGPPAAPCRHDAGHRRRRRRSDGAQRRTSGRAAASTATPSAWPLGRGPVELGRPPRRRRPARRAGGDRRRRRAVRRRAGRQPTSAPALRSPFAASTPRRSCGR